MSEPARKLEAVPDRNYVAELRAIVDAETAQGPYVAAAVASHVVRKLRVTDPDLLLGFLEAQAEYLVRQMIIQRDCSARSHARVTASRSAFRESAKLHEAGQPEALVAWLTVPFPVEDGTRKKLSELDASDLVFVADRYEQRATENKLMADFLRALRKKVGKRTVGAVYSDAQLTSMWQSLTGSGS